MDASLCLLRSVVGQPGADGRFGVVGHRIPIGIAAPNLMATIEWVGRRAMMARCHMT